MLYRICTENINRRAIERIITNRFSGFTIIEAQGFWKGVKEQSLVIEIITFDNDKNINLIAEEIKKYNEQYAVLIQKINCNHWLI